MTFFFFEVGGEMRKGWLKIVILKLKRWALENQIKDDSHSLFPGPTIMQLMERESIRKRLRELREED